MIERIVGSKVRQLRKERGLDRDELAGRAGMTRGRIVEIENDGIQDIQNPDMWALVRALDCLPEDILGCIRLMRGLVDEFKEWLEWQNVEPPEEEIFATAIPCTEIVRALFLSGTGHDGGTSCHMKLRELGIDRHSEHFGCFPEEDDDE